MKQPKYQYFTLEEYQQRLDALRSGMAQKGVDAMLVTTPENLCYISGYQTPGQFFYGALIVSMDREPVFVPRGGENGNVEFLSWVEDSRPYMDLEDSIAHTKNVLVDLDLEGKRIGLEYDSFFLTSRDHLHLKALMANTTFVDCSGLVEAGRMIKSPQEIEYIRQAARAADAGMLAGIEASKVGATENEVAAEVHRAQILAGSEYTGYPLFIASGERSYSLGHSTWYRKRLEPNESVKLELVGCINRYHAANWRPVLLGEPTKYMLEGMELVLEVLQMCKDAIKPGVTCGEMFDLVQERTKETNLGYRGQPRRVAYSMGIAYAPDWGEGHIISMWKGDTRPLQAGMTFHLLPGGMIVPGVGMLFCTDTILVTDSGCETLTNGVQQKLYLK